MIHAKAIIGENGTLLLNGLPFQPGDEVDVAIEKKSAKAAPRRSLAGTLIRYDEPFESALSPEEWESIQ